MAPSVALSNTTCYREGVVIDDLTTPEDLHVWLRQAASSRLIALVPADVEAITEADLLTARTLRHAIRALAEAATAGDVATSTDVAVVNSHVRSVPVWVELRAGDRLVSHQARGESSQIESALADVARDAVDLLGADRLRMCKAPSCILLYVRARAGQRWCSDGCGNRARVARHYARAHTSDSLHDRVEREPGKRT